jgi:hypothetical protein
LKWNCRFFEFFLSILNTKPWNIDHKKGSSWLETSIFSFNAIHYSAVYPTFLLFSFLDHFRTSKDWGKEEIKSHTWGAAQNSTWKIEEKQTVVSVTKLFHVCVFMYIFFFFSVLKLLWRDLSGMRHWSNRSWPHSAPKCAKMRLRLKGCLAMLLSCLICLICFFQFFLFMFVFVYFVGCSCYHCLFVIHKTMIRRMQLKLKYKKMKRTVSSSKQQ